jgi:hypothetical protein
LHEERETESKQSEDYVQAVQSGAGSGSNLGRWEGMIRRGGTVNSSWRGLGTVELVEPGPAVADEGGSTFHGHAMTLRTPVGPNWCGHPVFGGDLGTGTAAYVSDVCQFRDMYTTLD